MLRQPCGKWGVQIRVAQRRSPSALRRKRSEDQLPPSLVQCLRFSELAKGLQGFPFIKAVTIEFTNKRLLLGKLPFAQRHLPFRLGKIVQ